MTTRQFLSCAAVACLMSAGALAQTQTPPPKTSPALTPSSNANRVTVSGCVERADQMQSASATTTVDSLSFVLIKPTVEKPIPQARIDYESRVIRCGIYPREIAHRKKSRKSYRTTEV